MGGMTGAGATGIGAGSACGNAMDGMTGAGGTGTGARGASWTGGIGSTGPNGTLGQGGIYIGCSWCATCSGCSMTGGASCVVRGGDLEI